MRTTKVVLGLALVWIGLGCAGMGEVAKQLSGAEVNVSEGTDAKVPANFPLPAPDGGTVLTVADLGMMGVKTTTVVYTLPGDAALDPIFAKYEEVMTAAGMTVNKVDSDGNRTVSGNKDKVTWTATTTPQDGKIMLSLVVADASGM